MNLELKQVLRSSKVIFCVGAGGVGKTTSAAALALTAARMGRHCAVLTIDPAKRLAQALGLEKMGNEARAVKQELTAPGSVDAMMLESADAFDQMIRNLVKDPAKQKKLLENGLYQVISKHLGGSHEYMAVEKLYSLIESKKYDLLVIDTPPSVNALDFFDAPKRIQNFFSDRIQRFFIQREQKTARLFTRLKAKAGDMAVTLLSKTLGEQFVQDVQEFATAFQDLFVSFRLRGEVVEALLSDDKTAFCLVCSPDPVRVDEAIEMIRALKEMQIMVSFVLLNRTRQIDKETEETITIDDLNFLEITAGEREILLGDMHKANQLWQTLVQRDQNGLNLLRKNLPNTQLLMLPEQNTMIEQHSPVEHVLQELEKKLNS